MSETIQCACDGCENQIAVVPPSKYQRITCSIKCRLAHTAAQNAQHKRNPVHQLKAGSKRIGKLSSHDAL